MLALYSAARCRYSLAVSSHAARSVYGSFGTIASIRLVVNWPEIQTKRFDFATFQRKEKMQIFGLADHVGTLESRKVANVIVTIGDPLEFTSEVRYLFIRGQLTSLDNRQKRLFEKYSARPKS